MAIVTCAGLIAASYRRTIGRWRAGWLREMFYADALIYADSRAPLRESHVLFGAND